MNWNKSNENALRKSVLLLLLMLVPAVAWADKQSRSSSSSGHSASSSKSTTRASHAAPSTAHPVQKTRSGAGPKPFASTKSGLSVPLEGGGTARTRPDGSLRSIDKNGVHIEHNLHGGRTIVSTHVGARIVTTGRHVGYVQRAYVNRGGHLYYSRTYYDHGVYRTGVYRDYYYRGHTYYVYHRPHWYQPLFYQWVYEAAFWLTDYLIAANLQAAYTEQMEAYADAVPIGGMEVVVRGNHAWTDTGTFVNAGDEIAITASGGVTMGLGWTLVPPSGRSPNCTGSGFPIREIPCWSLIGRIGNGPMFYVGNERTLSASNVGELFLGVNDNVLWDNGGSWVANIIAPAAGKEPDQPNAAPANDQAAGPGQPAAAPGTEVKQAIAEEVKAQIAAAESEAIQNGSSVGSQQSTPIGEEMPPALDPAHRTFVVSTGLSVVADGQECALTPGDVITRIVDTPDQDQLVNVRVASSKKDDCAVGKIVAVSVDDLQEMHNHFLEQIDEGLKTLAAKQGAGGLPKAPDTSIVASDLPTPAADTTAGKALEDQEKAADQLESEVK